MGKNFFLRKFTEWEYWSSYMFYGPNIPFALCLAIKARSFTFFSAVNPGIKSSGNGTESKFETLELIPDEFKPKSILIDKERDFEKIIENIKREELIFPLIAKPDVGFRGNLVKKLKNEEELHEYVTLFPYKFIIQDFIDLPNECGVFYHKYPNEKRGAVTSLTLKSFMSVVGDGFSTVEELVKKNERAKHYVKRLKNNNFNIWLQVLPKNKIVILSEIGNHARGTQFINGTNLIDKDLENVFNKLSSHIPGLFYGRYDIKYNTIEELKQGKNFKFLEVNGIIAEPIQIYDATSMSYMEALKTFRNHWKIMYKIAMQNHQNGVPFMKSRAFWKEIRDLMRYVKEIKKLPDSK
jgi:hypothetical protein